MILSAAQATDATGALLGLIVIGLLVLVVAGLVRHHAIAQTKKEDASRPHMGRMEQGDPSDSEWYT